MIKNETRYIRIAATVALIGNAVLALLKISMGTFLKSGALIGDGIDSSTDVLISAITLVVVKVMSKPADAEHPWGHKRAETVATAFLSFIILFAGAQLIINSISVLASGAPPGAPSELASGVPLGAPPGEPSGLSLGAPSVVHAAAPSIAAVIVTLVSIAGKTLLAISQHLLGKRANSAMLKANAKNMAGDVFISVGVLLGFGIAFFTGSPYADPIVAALIGIWIIKTAVDIFLDANMELMDGNSDTKSYRIIVEAVDSVEGAGNPHRARMRRIAGFWDISFDISVDPNRTVTEAHKIATQVEKEIKARLENVFDIMIHVEPQGDNGAEAFGLSADKIIAQREAAPKSK